MLSANYPQFETYLQSISEKYKCWWNFYTLTDAEGKKTQQQQFSSPFDFGLIVQTVQPKQEQEKHEQEKIERLPVLEGIRKYAGNHVLLRGKPGSGKSTALARLLLEEAKAHLEIYSLASSVNDTKIPVLIELRYWQTSIFELIQAFLQHHDANLNLDETTLKNLLCQGKFLLLIDGVNELPSEESRRQVGLFRKKFSQTPMIFTTRDLGVGGDLGIEKKLEMQPLNETQMRDFVISYLPQQGEEMLQRLGDRLQEFGKTPLLLWMLCGLFQQTGDIPSNLGMVFRLFTQSYESNLRGDVVVTAESHRWWKSLLEHLAFVMMQGEPVTEFRVAISKREVEDIFTKYLTEEKFDKPRDYAKCWLEDLIKHHLIQVESGDKIEFRHQLLQEYYAAEYLLRQLPDISDAKLQRDYLNLLKWTEPVALMLALVEEEAQALRVVRLGLDIDLMLGARLAGEVRPEFQQQTIDYILEKNLTKLPETELLGITRSELVVNILINALKYEDYDVHSSAVQALGKIGGKAAVGALINALKYEDSLAPWRAAQELGKIGCEAAVDALINAFYYENDLLRNEAARALGEIGSQTAVDALINALNHEDYDVCRKAAEALGETGSEAAVDALINALNHEDSYICETAAKALGKIGSKAAVDALISALHHQDESILSSAVRALGNTDGEAAVDALANILSEVYEEFNFILEEAADSLGKIGNKAAADVLINALNHQDSFVRSSAARALGIIGGEAVDALINILDDEDSNVRFNAVYALGNTGREAAVDALINILDDEDSDVRWSAARALGIIGGEAVDALINPLKHENSFVHSSAAYALVNAGNEAAVDVLINALNNQDFSVRWSAVNALVNIGSKAVDALINALNSEDYLVYWSAQNALVNIGNEAVDPLINVLDDDNFSGSLVVELLGEIGSQAAVNALTNTLYKDSDLHRSAAYALGNIGSEAAVDALFNVLTHEYLINISSRISRTEAINSLRRIGSKSAVDALINVLNYNVSNHEYLVYYPEAAEALGEIGSETAVDALINALNHEEYSIRISAADALEKIADSGRIAKMWELLENGIIKAKYTILKIQERYKFYNHEIFHSLPVEEQENHQNSKYSIQAETVQIIEKNDGSIYGKLTS